MPATKSLQDLFINPIKDKYYAEKQSRFSAFVA